MNHTCLLHRLSLALQNGCIPAPRGRSTPELQIVLLAYRSVSCSWPDFDFLRNMVPHYVQSYKLVSIQ